MMLPWSRQVETEIAEHEGQQWRDDPAVETDEAEPEAQERHRLPFVTGVPTRRCCPIGH